jgi:hypothetical protein
MFNTLLTMASVLILFGLALAFASGSVMPIVVVGFVCWALYHVADGLTRSGSSHSHPPQSHACHRRPQQRGRGNNHRTPRGGRRR